MITADKIFKGNTEIIKIYKGLNLEWEQAAPIPSADDYVLNGLVFQLDGIDRGNVDGAWVDRKAKRQFTLNNCIVNSDNIEFNGTDSYAVDPDNKYFPINYSNNNYTVEIVMYYKKGSLLGAAGGSSNQFYLSIIPINDYNYEQLIVGTRSSTSPGDTTEGLQMIPKNTYMSFQMDTNGATVSGNCNGNVLSRYYNGTSGYKFKKHSSKAVIGCRFSSTSKSDFLEGKIYAIRIYHRKLTLEEKYNNMLIDYKRFKIPIMDKFNVDLSNDLGEKINEALFIVNGTLFNYNGSPIYVPKGHQYFIWFNNIKNHTAPKAIIDLKGSNILATYHYTGFEGMIFEATVTDSDKLAILPFLNTITQVDWGDGSVDTSWTHTYASAGSYIIKLLGDFDNVRFYSDRFLGKNITKILQFPYNISVSTEITGYLRITGNLLNYIAPLILNEQSDRTAYIRPDDINKDCNCIDCYAINGNSLINMEASSGYCRDSFYTRAKNVDTTILGGRDSTYNLNKIYTIKHLYKLVTYFSTITYDDPKPNYNNFFSSITNIRYVEIPKEFWEQHGNKITHDFSKLYYWGTESEENRLSMVNTLTKNAPDLVSEQYPTETISLSTNTKALLTEEEIAQITAKGYTIA